MSRREGPLGRRERVARRDAWLVVSEQFAAPDGSWRWDVYLTPVPERADMIEKLLEQRGPDGQDFSHLLPEWERRRLLPRLPVGPNVHDDPAAEEERLVALVNG